MHSRHALGELFRYAVVGVVSNVLLYISYLALTETGLPVKISMTLMYIVGVVQTFFFNQRWTFRQTGWSRPVFLRYCIAYCAGYIINLIGLLILVDFWNLNHQWAQAGMIILVALVIFTIQKYWIFRTASRQASMGEAYE